MPSRVRRALRAARRSGAMVVVAVLAGGGAVAAALAPGYPPSTLDVLAPQVWLPSFPTGQVALVDGTTSEVLARRAVAPAGHPLAVAQTGPDVVVLDHTDGSLARVDAATHRVGPTGVRPPLAEQDLALVSGPGSVHVLGVWGGDLMRLAPAALEPDGPTGSLGVRLEPEDVVAGDAGRLWALDREGGHLVRVVGSEVRATWELPEGAGPLLLAGGAPAVVDVAGNRVVGFDPNGRPATRACLPPVARAPDAVVAGAREDGVVVVVSGALGQLAVTDLATGRCGTVTRLSARPTTFGTPVIASGRAFVPEPRTGQVHVVRLADGTVIASPDVVAGADAPALELVERAGAVFYNDPATERAGVVRLDGSHLGAQKYNPVRPEEGLEDAAPAQPPDAGEDAGRSSGSRDPSRLEIGLSTVPVVAGQTVGMQVRDPFGGRLVDVTWSLGDGSPPDERVALTHAWAVPGRYVVTVAAHDSTGRRRFGSARIEVVAEEPAPTPPPTVAPTATPAPGPTSGPGPTNRPTSRPTQPPVDPSPTADPPRPSPPVTEPPPSPQPPTAQPPSPPPPPAPVARLTLSRTTGHIDLTVTADLTGSTEPQEGITRLLDWSDGGLTEVTEAALRHTFTRPGTYPVRLVVRSTDGTEASESVTVVVDDLPFGRDTCLFGYVWRDAYAGDHVCVTGDRRSQAAADNAAHPARVEPGTTDTCLAGYVWRLTRAEDHVCVLPATRDEVIADDAAAEERYLRKAPQ